MEFKLAWNSTLKKKKIIASGPITSWQVEGEKVEAVTNFILRGSKITVDRDCSHESIRHVLLGSKAMINLSSVQYLSHVQLLVTPWTAAPRLLCPPLSPGVCSDSCPLSQWSHPSILSSVTRCPQSFPASKSFPKSQLFESGGQSIGASASASVLPMNIQGWFLLELIGLIFLLFKILARVLQHRSLKVSILWDSAFFMVQLSHPYMTIGKTIGLTIWAFVSKVISQLFNVLPRFVIAFLPRSKCLLISWLQSSSAVILEPSKMKSVTVSPSICRMSWS